MTQVISGLGEGPTAVTTPLCGAKAAAACLLENKSLGQKPVNSYSAALVRYGGRPSVANSICTLSVGSSESFHFQHCPDTTSRRAQMPSPCFTTAVQDAQTARLEMIPSCQPLLCLFGQRLDELGGEIMLESTFLVSETTQATGTYTSGPFSALPGMVSDCFLLVV